MSIKILNIKEVEELWNNLPEFKSKIPKPRVRINSALITKHGFDVANIYTLYTKHLKNKLTEKKETIELFKKLILDIRKLYYTEYYYDDYCWSASSYVSCRGKNIELKSEYLSILNTLNQKFLDAIETDKYDIAINYLLIAIDKFSEVKEPSFYLLRNLAIIIAPIMPYVAEIVWHTMPKKEESIFLTTYPKPNAYLLNTGFSKYPVYINGYYKFRFKLFDSLEDDASLEVFKSSLALKENLNGRTVESVKFLRDKLYLVITNE